MNRTELHALVVGVRRVRERDHPETQQDQLRRRDRFRILPNPPPGRVDGLRSAPPRASGTPSGTEPPSGRTAARPSAAPCTSAATSSTGGPPQAARPGRPPESTRPAPKAPAPRRPTAPAVPRPSPRQSLDGQPTRIGPPFPPGMDPWERPRWAIPQTVQKGTPVPCWSRVNGRNQSEPRERDHGQVGRARAPHHAPAREGQTKEGGIPRPGRGEIGLGNPLAGDSPLVRYPGEVSTGGRPRPSHGAPDGTRPLTSMSGRRSRNANTPAQLIVSVLAVG